MDQFFTHIAAKIATAVGQPLAFVIAFLAIVVWGLSGPVFAFSDTWQLIVNTSTTIITFLMVFLIQNAQNRDAAAMQAKLDEIIRAIEPARNGYIGIEHLTEKEVTQMLGGRQEAKATGDAKVEPVLRVIKSRKAGAKSKASAAKSSPSKGK